MKRVCVFTGSSPGARPEYTQAAEALAAAIVSTHMELVYGGAQVGLMGTIANAVLARGGRVTGVIPASLARKEIMHEGLSELHVVDSMHERKAKMADLASGFVAMPGGIGTIEEIFEVLTWAQLGMHAKPCGLLNVAGYYDRLIEFLETSVEERFLRGEHREMLLVDDEPSKLIESMRRYSPPKVEKWIDRAQR